MKINVHSSGFTAKPSELEFAEQKVTKLLRFEDEIMDADVTLRLDNSADGKHVADIKLKVKGDELFASKSGASIQEAVDECVDALRGQLLRRKGKIRG